MMIIAPVDQFQMQVHGCGIGDSIEKLPNHLCVKCSDFLHSKRDVTDKVWSSAKVYRAHHQGFIHGEKGTSVTADSFFISCCLQNSLPQNDPGILDGMMAIHVKVSLHLADKVEETMTGKTVQHMIKETDPGICFALSAAVQVQIDHNLGLTCGALYMRCPLIFHQYHSSSKRTAMELAWAVRCSALAKVSISLCTALSASFE